jgi:hypothetical protein
MIKQYLTLDSGCHKSIQDNLYSLSNNIDVSYTWIDWHVLKSEYISTMGSSAISLSSKKQPIVTLSTTEAEFVSAAACACQCIWLRNILNRLDVKQDKSSKINCDNSSSIKLLKNPIMHGRCKSQEQLADIMTKALKLDTFCKLREGIGMCDSSSIGWGFWSLLIALCLSFYLFFLCCFLCKFCLLCCFF